MGRRVRAGELGRGAKGSDAPGVAAEGLLGAPDGPVISGQVGGVPGGRPAGKDLCNSPIGMGTTSVASRNSKLVGAEH